MATPYDVNGKTPLAAWIPSLDSAGNATTTLTDLIGSNNGTLTNMDAATDWVADTDNGGVRALDFDGSNDNVGAGANPAFSVGTNDLAISCWAKWPSYDGTTRIIFRMAFSTSGGACGIFMAGAELRGHFRNSAGEIRVVLFSVPASNTWHHLLVFRSAGTVHFYINNTLAGTVAGANINLINHAETRMSGNTLAAGGGQHFLGRLDDIRIFGFAPDAADRAYLYGGGNGRGVIASTGSSAAAVHFFQFGF